MNKKLTIGIPTWNRAKEIRDALDSVVVQLESNEKLKSEVEIFVSINASTDNTEDVVKEYQEKYSDIEIRYFVQPQNFGADRNIDNLFKHAKGEFVWILSDDDALENRAIEKIVQIIYNYKDDNLGVLFVNYSGYSNDLNEIVGDSEVWFSKCDQSQLFANYKKLFDKTKSIGTSLISSNIIKKDFWNELDLEQFMSSYIIHVCVDLLLYQKGISVYVEYSKLVKYRTDNRFGRDIVKSKANPFDFNYSAFFVINNLIKKMDKDIYKFFYKTEFNQLLKGIAYYKSQAFSLDNVDISKSIFKFCGYKIESILLIIALFLPNFIYKIIYKFKK